MTPARITDEDRAAAHALCGLTSNWWCSWTNQRFHGEHCDDVAQAIADACARENQGCYEDVCETSCLLAHAGDDGCGCPCLASAEQAIAARRTRWMTTWYSLQQLRDQIVLARRRGADDERARIAKAQAPALRNLRNLLMPECMAEDGLPGCTMRGHFEDCPRGMFLEALRMLRAATRGPR
jgi:hypothetical protein